MSHDRAWADMALSAWPRCACDSFKSSPFHGRVYVTWGHIDSPEDDAPAVLRWSDDQGRSWSPLVHVTARSASASGVQPLIQPTGRLTITYLGFLPDGTAIHQAQSSNDGGRTFTAPRTIADDRAFFAEDLRAGLLPTATVDPVTGLLYHAWAYSRFRRDRLNDIVLSSSHDGRRWTPPRRVNHDDPASHRDRFTPDVAAHGGRVSIFYLSRRHRDDASNLVDQRISTSADAGVRFGAEQVVGPLTDLRFAALSPRPLRFLGDYMGSAAVRDRLYAVWCRAWRPPDADAGTRLHQTTWSVAGRHTVGM